MGGERYVCEHGGMEGAGGASAHLFSGFSGVVRGLWCLETPEIAGVVCLKTHGGGVTAFFALPVNSLRLTSPAQEEGKDGAHCDLRGRQRHMDTVGQLAPQRSHVLTCVQGL